MWEQAEEEGSWAVSGSVPRPRPDFLRRWLKRRMDFAKSGAVDRCVEPPYSITITHIEL